MFEAISDPEVDALPDDDEDDEEFFVNRARNPYHLGELDLPRWKDDLLKDKETLTVAWERVSEIGPERDGKLLKIKAHIRNKAQSPTTDKDGRINRKILVFTTLQRHGGIPLREPYKFRHRIGTEHGDGSRHPDTYLFRRQ